MKRSWGVSTGMDPHICATCTSYEYMSPADACHVWLKAVTFTVLERLVKSKRSASDLVPYHISAQLILLTYYSRYIGGTAVDSFACKWRCKMYMICNVCVYVICGAVGFYAKFSVHIYVNGQVPIPEWGCFQFQGLFPSHSKWANGLMSLMLY